ncbi:Argininosuccinate synthase [Bienertia sinuspersici]
MKGITVRDIENNLFMFSFLSASDKAKVLDDGPWSFDKSPLLLKEIENDEHPSEISLDTIHFWVKAYDVPLDKCTKSMAVSMASKMDLGLDNGVYGVSGYMGGFSWGWWVYGWVWGEGCGWVVMELRVLVEDLDGWGLGTWLGFKVDYGG